MSGGARNDKRRQQEARQARLAAAGITPPPSRAPVNRTPLIIGGVVVVVIVVVAAVYYFMSSRTVAPTYSTTVSGGVVTAGSGPVVIDMYEDFLCPGCRALEQRDGNAVVDALNANKVTVKYHMLGFLDGSTKPAGYSTRAADASLCAAKAGIYGAYRQKLFDNQPAENGPGLTDDQLVAFGTDLGAPADFATCVKGTTHDADVKKETTGAGKNKDLQTNGAFATPTATVNGKKVDVLSSGSWLSTALGG